MRTLSQFACLGALFLAVQLVLDPDKDQDGDGMPNGFEEQYGLDPFKPADALSDPDLDGLTCLEEAAYGSDPNDPASANHPTAVEVDYGGALYLALSYIRSKDVTTLTIAAEVSGDLITWNSGAAYTTKSLPVDNGDGTETIVERMNTPINGSPRDFMRLAVTAASP